MTCQSYRHRVSSNPSLPPFAAEESDASNLLLPPGHSPRLPIKQPHRCGCEHTRNCLQILKCSRGVQQMSVPIYQPSPGPFFYPQGIPASAPRPPFIAPVALPAVRPPAPPQIPHPLESNDSLPVPLRHSSPSDHDEAATAARAGRGMRGGGRQTRGRGRAGRGAIKRIIGLHFECHAFLYNLKLSYKTRHFVNIIMYCNIMFT